MKIEAHDWKIEVKEDTLRITVVYNENESNTIVLNRNFDVLSKCFAQKVEGLIEGISFGVESNLWDSNVSDLEIKQPTEYIPTTTPVHVDRYGKELKVGDRIYLEEGQEAINLTGEAYWKSQHIEFNDCFTILEIDNKITTCDWGLDRTGNKILTSELSKFTKI